MICKPTGRPVSVAVPAGTDRPGRLARLSGSVNRSKLYIANESSTLSPSLNAVVDRLDDGVQLPCDVIELLWHKRNARQLGNPGDFLAGDRLCFSHV